MKKINILLLLSFLAHKPILCMENRNKSQHLKVEDITFREKTHKRTKSETMRMLPSKRTRHPRARSYDFRNMFSTQNTPFQPMQKLIKTVLKKGSEDLPLKTENVNYKKTIHKRSKSENIEMLHKKATTPPRFFFRNRKDKSKNTSIEITLEDSQALPPKLRRTSCLAPLNEFETQNDNQGHTESSEALRQAQENREEEEGEDTSELEHEDNSIVIEIPELEHREKPLSLEMLNDNTIKHIMLYLEGKNLLRFILSKKRFLRLAKDIYRFHTKEIANYQKKINLMKQRIIKIKEKRLRKTKKQKQFATKNVPEIIESIEPEIQDPIGNPETDSARKQKRKSLEKQLKDTHKEGWLEGWGTGCGCGCVSALITVAAVEGLIGLIVCICIVT